MKKIVTDQDLIKIKILLGLDSSGYKIVDEWFDSIAGIDETFSVDSLSNIIREADGSNQLGAGALAEKIHDAIFSEVNSNKAFVKKIGD